MQSFALSTIGGSGIDVRIFLMGGLRPPIKKILTNLGLPGLESATSARGQVHPSFVVVVQASRSRARYLHYRN